MKNFTYFLIALLSAASRLTASPSIPEVPFKGMVGKWLESGEWIQPAPKKTPSQTWISKISDDGLSFSASSADGMLWKYRATESPNLFDVEYYMQDKKIADYIAIWDPKAETLIIEGGQESGLDRITAIHLPKNGKGKTHVVWINSKGLIEFEWLGSSRLIQINKLSPKTSNP